MKRATGLGASAAKSAANASGSTARKPSPTGPTLLAAAGILSLRSATLSPTSGSKAAIEKMLERMYVGDPPGAYDRLLDFSTPHTGTTFFAPSRPTLQKLAQAAQAKLTAPT